MDSRCLYRGNRTEIHVVEHPNWGACVRKTLRAFCDVESERRQVQREVFLQNYVQHPGIVPAYGHDGPSLYRRYVRGPTLSEGADSTVELGVDRAITTVRELCMILETMHAGSAGQRLVHGDVTPSNMYWEDGRVVLSDFDMALLTEAGRGAVEPEARRAAATTLRGTPRFLPPEVMRGEPLSPASDVYQASLLLAWLLVAQLRRQTRGLSSSHVPLREHWAGAQAWHVPAREVLERYGWAKGLDPDPACRPTASQLLALLGH